MHALAQQLFACCMTLALAGCGTAPVQETSAQAAQQSQATAGERMVATVRAAAGNGDGELAIQPLRDAQVEDLRQQAHAFEQQRRYADAARVLDQALAIVPDDPAVLQERAEAALLLRDYTGAERFAQRAFDRGSQVGPLCRRHWAAIRQARFARNDGAGAAQAQTALDACRVAPPARY